MRYEVRIMWRTLGGGGGRWTHLGDGGFYSHGVDSGHWGVSSLWTPCQDEENKKKNISEWHNSTNKLSCSFSKHFLTSACACVSNQHLMQTDNRPEFSVIYLPSLSPSLPRDVVDLTSREPFLLSLCLLDWMSGEKKTPHVNTQTQTQFECSDEADPGSHHDIPEGEDEML